jgi:hypothetical protein
MHDSGRSVSISPPSREADMDKITDKTLKALKKRGLRSWFAETADGARDLILGLVPADAMVGCGDSSTIRQLRIIEALRNRGNRTVNPFDITNTLKDQQSYFDFLFWPSLVASVCEVFLTGSNAVTEDGKIVSIDGAGNRVSGMFWGHQKSIIVVGTNKITKNLDDAMKRIKNVVAPEHIRRKGGSPPCTTTGKCHDCSGERRICAVTTIIEHKPITTEINVVIVNEDLGLGWDRSWPQERIESIAANHERFMCPLPPAAAERTDINKLWEMAQRKTGGRWLLGGSGD